MCWETRLLKPSHSRLDQFYDTILPFMPRLIPTCAGLASRRGFSYGLEHDLSPTDCIGKNLRGPGAMVEYHRTGPSGIEPLSGYEVKFDLVP
jgi:hypothetical protein